MVQREALRAPQLGRPCSGEQQIRTTARRWRKGHGHPDIPNLPAEGDGKAGEPCLGAQAVLPWVPLLSSPLPQKIPHRTRLPSVAHGEAEEPLSGGTPRSSPPFTNPPLPPALSPADPGGPRVAPLGRGSDTAGPVSAAPSPASIRPPWDSLQSARPRAARLPAPGARAPIASAPRQWEVAGGSHSPEATGCISQRGHGRSCHVTSQLSGAGLSPEQPHAQGPAVHGLGFLVVVCFPFWFLLCVLFAAHRPCSPSPLPLPFACPVAFHWVAWRSSSLAGSARRTRPVPAPCSTARSHLCNWEDWGGTEGQGTDPTAPLLPLTLGAGPSWGSQREPNPCPSPPVLLPRTGHRSLLGGISPCPPCTPPVPPLTFFSVPCKR